MAFFDRIISTLRARTTAEPQAGSKKTDDVMGEFLGAFGPTEELRTEDAAVMESLLDVDADTTPAEADPFADWGKSQ